MERPHWTQLLSTSLDSLRCDEGVGARAREVLERSDVSPEARARVPRSEAGAYKTMTSWIHIVSFVYIDSKIYL